MNVDMKRFKLGFYPLLLVGSLAFSGSAYAQVTKHYDFGILVGANPDSYTATAPNSFGNNPFAHLQIDDFGTYSDYELSINNNLFSSFGPGAYLSSIYFDYVPNTGSGYPTTLLGSNVAGMSVTGTPGTTYGGVVFDFGDVFGVPSGAQLVNNAYVKWSVSGVGSVGGYRLANSDVTVNNITLPSGGPYRAKYAMIPVSEPETYAMLLAGLGLFGFTARRRKSNIA